jgi:hypothetical protein
MLRPKWRRLKLVECECDGGLAGYLLGALIRGFDRKSTDTTRLSGGTRKRMGGN